MYVCPLNFIIKLYSHFQIYIMRNLLFVLFIFFSVFVQAQTPEFVLTKDGFVNKDEPSKTYIVYDVDNTSQGILYGRVLKFLTIHYKSAKDVLSKVENEVITINAAERSIVPCKTLKYDLKYTLSVSFKDNKIKIDAPDFACNTFAHGKPYRLTMSGSNGGFGSEVTVGLFKKDGKQGQEQTIKYLEDFFNLLSLQIIRAAATDSASEDW